MGVINIKGYAAHFGRANRNKEIVKPGSFNRFFAYRQAMREDGIEDVIPVNFNHDPRKRVGVVSKFDVDDKGLIVEAALSESMLERYGIADYVANGVIDSFSTEGYVDGNTAKLNSDGTYTANVFDLTAVAIVSNPADAEATFKRNNDCRVSYFGREMEEIESETLNKKQFITVNQIIKYV